MRAADNGLRGEMVRRLKPYGYELSPIETGSVTSGVPDATWCHVAERASGWIECKATDGWAVSFRPHQLGWAARRVACGDRVAVAVRARGLGSGLGKGDALWLLLGSCAATLAEHGLNGCVERLPDSLLGRWGGPPRLWDWAAVAELLLQP